MAATQQLARTGTIALDVPPMLSTAVAKVCLLEEQNSRLQQALEGLRQLDDAEIAKLWERIHALEADKEAVAAAMAAMQEERDAALHKAADAHAQITKLQAQLQAAEKAARHQGHHSEGREKERSKWDEAPSRGHSNEVEALKRQLRDKEGVIADLTDSLEAEKRASQKAKAEVVALQESLKESKVQVFQAHSARMEQENIHKTLQAAHEALAEHLDATRAQAQRTTAMHHAELQGVQAEVERLRAQVVHMSNEAEQLRRSGPPQMVADLAHANSEAAHLRSTMSVLASDVQRAQARVLTLETEYRRVCQMRDHLLGVVDEERRKAEEKQAEVVEAERTEKAKLAAKYEALKKANVKQASQLAAITRERDELVVKHRSLQDERKDMERSVTALQAKQEKLEQEVAARDKTIASLTRKVKRARRRLSAEEGEAFDEEEGQPSPEGHTSHHHTSSHHHHHHRSHKHRSSRSHSREGRKRRSSDGSGGGTKDGAGGTATVPPPPPGDPHTSHLQRSSDRSEMHVAEREEGEAELEEGEAPPEPLSSARPVSATTPTSAPVPPSKLPSKASAASAPDSAPKPSTHDPPSALLLPSGNALSAGAAGNAPAGHHSATAPQAAAYGLLGSAWPAALVAGQQQQATSAAGTWYALGMPPFTAEPLTNTTAPTGIAGGLSFPALLNTSWPGVNPAPISATAPQSATLGHSDHTAHTAPLWHPAQALAPALPARHLPANPATGAVGGQWVVGTTGTGEGQQQLAATEEPGKPVVDKESQRQAAAKAEAERRRAAAAREQAEAVAAAFDDWEMPQAPTQVSAVQRAQMVSVQLPAAAQAIGPTPAGAVQAVQEGSTLVSMQVATDMPVAAAGASHPQPQPQSDGIQQVPSDPATGPAVTYPAGSAVTGVPAGMQADAGPPQQQPGQQGSTSQAVAAAAAAALIAEALAGSGAAAGAIAALLNVPTQGQVAAVVPAPLVGSSTAAPVVPVPGPASDHGAAAAVVAVAPAAVNVQQHQQELPPHLRQVPLPPGNNTSLELLPSNISTQQQQGLSQAAQLGAHDQQLQVIAIPLVTSAAAPMPTPPAAAQPSSAVAARAGNTPAGASAAAAPSAAPPQGPKAGAQDSVLAPSAAASLQPVLASGPAASRGSTGAASKPAPAPAPQPSISSSHQQRTAVSRGRSRSRSRDRDRGRVRSRTRSRSGTRRGQGERSSLYSRGSRGYSPARAASPRRGYQGSRGAAARRDSRSRSRSRSRTRGWGRRGSRSRSRSRDRDRRIDGGTTKGGRARSRTRSRSRSPQRRPLRSRSRSRSPVRRSHQISEPAKSHKGHTRARSPSHEEGEIDIEEGELAEPAAPSPEAAGTSKAGVPSGKPPARATSLDRPPKPTTAAAAGASAGDGRHKSDSAAGEVPRRRRSSSSMDISDDPHPGKTGKLRVDVEQHPAEALRPAGRDPDSSRSAFNSFHSTKRKSETPSEVSHKRRSEGPSDPSSRKGKSEPPADRDPALVDSDRWQPQGPSTGSDAPHTKGGAKADTQPAGTAPSPAKVDSDRWQPKGPSTGSEAGQQAGGSTPGVAGSTGALPDSTAVPASLPGSSNVNVRRFHELQPRLAQIVFRYQRQAGVLRTLAVRHLHNFSNRTMPLAELVRRLVSQAPACCLQLAASVKGKNAALWTVRKPPTDGEMTAGIRSALDRCPVIELYKNGPPGPNQMWVRYDYQLLMRVAEVLPPLTPYMTYAQVTWPPMEVYSSPDVMTAVWRAAGSMQHPAKVLAESTTSDFETAAEGLFALPLEGPGGAEMRTLCTQAVRLLTAPKHETQRLTTPSQAEPFVPLEVLCHQLSDLCRWPSWQERNGLPEGSPLSLSRGDESLSKWRTLFAAAAGALELMVLEVPGDSLRKVQLNQRRLFELAWGEGKPLPPHVTVPPPPLGPGAEHAVPQAVLQALQAAPVPGQAVLPPPPPPTAAQANVSAQPQQQPAGPSQPPAAAATSQQPSNPQRAPYKLQPDNVPPRPLPPSQQQQQGPSQSQPQGKQGKKKKKQGSVEPQGQQGQQQQGARKPALFARSLAMAIGADEQQQQQQQQQQGGQQQPGAAPVQQGALEQPPRKSRSAQRRAAHRAARAAAAAAASASASAATEAPSEAAVEGVESAAAAAAGGTQAQSGEAAAAAANEQQYHQPQPKRQRVESPTLATAGVSAGAAAGGAREVTPGAASHPQQDSTLAAAGGTGGVGAAAHTEGSTATTAEATSGGARHQRLTLEIPDQQMAQGTQQQQQQQQQHQEVTSPSAKQAAEEYLQQYLAMTDPASQQGIPPLQHQGLLPAPAKPLGTIAQMKLQQQQQQQSRMQGQQGLPAPAQQKLLPGQQKPPLPPSQQQRSQSGAQPGPSRPAAGAPAAAPAAPLSRVPVNIGQTGAQQTQPEADPSRTEMEQCLRDASLLYPAVPRPRAVAPGPADKGHPTSKPGPAATGAAAQQAVTGAGNIAGPVDGATTTMPQVAEAAIVAAAPDQPSPTTPTTPATAGPSTPAEDRVPPNAPAKPTGDDPDSPQGLTLSVAGAAAGAANTGSLQPAVTAAEPGSVAAPASGQGGSKAGSMETKQHPPVVDPMERNKQQVRRILASYLLVTGVPPGPLGPHSAGVGALHGLLEEACPGAWVQSGLNDKPGALASVLTPSDGILEFIPPTSVPSSTRGSSPQPSQGQELGVVRLHITTARAAIAKARKAAAAAAAAAANVKAGGGGNANAPAGAGAVTQGPGAAAASGAGASAAPAAVQAARGSAQDVPGKAAAAVPGSGATQPAALNRGLQQQQRQAPAPQPAAGAPKPAAPTAPDQPLRRVSAGGTQPPGNAAPAQQRRVSAVGSPSVGVPGMVNPGMQPSLQNPTSLYQSLGMQPGGSSGSGLIVAGSAGGGNRSAAPQRAVPHLPALSEGFGPRPFLQQQPGGLHSFPSGGMMVPEHMLAQAHALMQQAASYQPQPPMYVPQAPTWQPSEPTWQPTEPTWQPTEPIWEPREPNWVHQHAQLGAAASAALMEATMSGMLPPELAMMAVASGQADPAAMGMMGMMMAAAAHQHPHQQQQQLHRRLSSQGSGPLQGQGQGAAPAAQPASTTVQLAPTTGTTRPPVAAVQSAAGAGAGRRPSNGGAETPAQPQVLAGEAARPAGAPILGKCRSSSSGPETSDKPAGDGAEPAGGPVLQDSAGKRRSSSGGRQASDKPAQTTQPAGTAAAVVRQAGLLGSSAQAALTQQQAVPRQLPRPAPARAPSPSGGAGGRDAGGVAEQQDVKSMSGAGATATVAGAGTGSGSEPVIGRAGGAAMPAGNGRTATGSKGHGPSIIGQLRAGRVSAQAPDGKGGAAPHSDTGGASTGSNNGQGQGGEGGSAPPVGSATKPQQFVDDLRPVLRQALAAAGVAQAPAVGPVHTVSTKGARAPEAAQKPAASAVPVMASQAGPPVPPSPSLQSTATTSVPGAASDVTGAGAGPGPEALKQTKAGTAISGAGSTRTGPEAKAGAASTTAGAADKAEMPPALMGGLPPVPPMPTVANTSTISSHSKPLSASTPAAGPMSDLQSDSNKPAGAARGMTSTEGVMLAQQQPPLPLPKIADIADVPGNPVREPQHESINPGQAPTQPPLPQTGALAPAPTVPVGVVPVVPSTAGAAPTAGKAGTGGGVPASVVPSPAPSPSSSRGQGAPFVPLPPGPRVVPGGAVVLAPPADPATPPSALPAAPLTVPLPLPAAVAPKANQGPGSSQQQQPTQAPLPAATAAVAAPQATSTVAPPPLPVVAATVSGPQPAAATGTAAAAALVVPIPLSTLPAPEPGKVAHTSTASVYIPLAALAVQQLGKEAPPGSSLASPPLPQLPATAAQAQAALPPAAVMAQLVPPQAGGTAGAGEVLLPPAPLPPLPAVTVPVPPAPAASPAASAAGKAPQQLTGRLSLVPENVLPAVSVPLPAPVTLLPDAAVPLLNAVGPLPGMQQGASDPAGVGGRVPIVSVPGAPETAVPLPAGSGTGVPQDTSIGKQSAVPLPDAQPAPPLPDITHQAPSST